MEEYIFEKINTADTKEIEQLSKENNGNKKLTQEFIQHWYFQNPSHSFSLWKVIVNNKTEGFATTNNFVYTINNKELHVAMPQNVLTSEKIRGKGLFNKLYFKTEVENIEENNIDAFLTFTNGLSTPIFLNKFDYKKGKCPVVIFNVFSPLLFFQKKNFEKLNSIDQIEASFFKNKFALPDSMKKDEAYYKWRYKNYDKTELHILKVADKSHAAIGFAFLKEERKKGAKFLIVMDVIAIKPEFISKIFRSCVCYSSKKFFAGTMSFALPFVQTSTNYFHFRIKDRFNFLVKGKNPEISEMLSTVDFNMFFGDMDIV